MTGIGVAATVFLRVAANPVSNVIQKKLAGRGADPVCIIAVTHALLTAACLPLARTAGLGAPFWFNMAVCAVLAVAGNVTLVYALRHGELSVLGPVNAYKSVVGMLLGVFLLGEIPTTLGLIGVALIIAGSYFVVDGGRGIGLRFLALCFSATEAVFLKRALLLSSPLTTFVFWSILGLPVAAAMARGRAVGFRANIRTYAALAAATGAMQLTTLYTFSAMQVGYSLALFQLSTLLAVFFGRHFFDEGHFGRRLLGSAVMAAGAILIVLKR